MIVINTRSSKLQQIFLSIFVVHVSSFASFRSCLGVPRWATPPFDPVLSTHSSITLNTPVMEASLQLPKLFQLEVRQVVDVLAGKVIVWSAWSRLAVTISSGRDFNQSTLVQGLPAGVDGLVQLQTRGVWPVNSSASTSSAWSPPLQVQLPLSGRD